MVLVKPYQSANNDGRHSADPAHPRADGDTAETDRGPEEADGVAIKPSGVTEQKFGNDNSTYKHTTLHSFRP